MFFNTLLSSLLGRSISNSMFFKRKNKYLNKNQLGTILCKPQPRRDKESVGRKEQKQNNKKKS